MNASEKRRGGGGTGGGSGGAASHALRAGSSHPHRHGSSAAGSGASNAAVGAVGGITTSGSGGNHSNAAGGSNMPAPPPRAAMVNANSSSPDESHEGGTTSGGVALTDRKERDTTDTVARKGSTSGSIKGKQKERERDLQRDREAALHREKDDRIAYLEREMGIMEGEFQRELDKLSQNESETATFWQSKHSALNQQFLRTDTELRLLRDEVAVREAEREELRQGWELLRRELKERDEEIRALRGQVRGLKEFVSTSTRTDGQTSDEVFGDGMTKLGNGLQNWVIMNFRKAKLLDLDKVDEATLAELCELVPMYEELVHTAKVHLLQSIVSKILVEMVFDAYFVGLSDEHTKHFRQMENMLSTFATSDEPVNQWRSSTLALLRRESPHLLSSSTTSFAESVVSRTNRLLDAITDASASRSEARDSALRVLVNNSVELARLLVAQKAVLKVYMPDILPHQSVFFEAETMDDIGGEDEDALGGREICCVVFPGVIKRGDESGGQMQFLNVIAKARVLCGPED